MKRININSTGHPLFLPAWKIIESSFPLSERRTLDEQIRIFADNTYFLEVWVDGENVLGIIGWWICDNLRFVEHYAIAPEYRSSGYGSSFLSEWIADGKTPVLLEIEPVIDKITQRRKNFYMKLGFVENDIKHLLPAYHKETGSVEMWILTYPHQISEKEYQQFYSKQCYIIMPSFT